ncbi:DUF4394 domain-containing protein [Actinokineospora pegani]|uniref:DUF4394 domain-containing protein n=1 Tax=Actinokineospora pegani TaxID=2654637 RepID=UPI0018D36279|nr:DUF4394 domain-containing protein [Actinokineospora pegani]
MRGLIATIAEAGAAATEKGPDLLVLGADGVLSRHDGDRLGKVERRVRVTGLAAGDRLVGMDVRPATGGVYAICVKGQLYTVDASSGKPWPWARLSRPPARPWAWT